MWEKKRELPSQPPVAPPHAHGTQGPANQALSRPQDAPAPGGSIGKAVKIIGDVISKEDLFLDGEIEGSVEARNCKLTIGVNGRAKSDIIAREIIIQGQVQGNCESSQKITIRKEGSLVGNIKTTGIVIEDDAYFKGSIDIVRNTEAAKAKE